MAGGATAERRETAVRSESVQVRRERRPCAPGSGPRESLADVLRAAQNDLRSSGVAACPVCAGTMERAGLEGRCRDCGSRLG